MRRFSVSDERDTPIVFCERLISAKTKCVAAVIPSGDSTPFELWDAPRLAAAAAAAAARDSRLLVAVGARHHTAPSVRRRSRILQLLFNIVHRIATRARSGSRSLIFRCHFSMRFALLLYMKCMNTIHIGVILNTQF